MMALIRRVTSALGVRDLFVENPPIFPGLAVLDRPDPLGTPALVHWIAPAAAFVLFVFSLGV